jgi:hypothetical protein
MDTDIIILTSIIVVLFLVFIIASVREFAEMSSKDYSPNYTKGGPPTDFLKLAGKLFTDEHVSIKKRIILTEAVKSALEDLEKIENQKPNNT